MHSLNRYLGCKQRFQNTVKDAIGLEPKRLVSLRLSLPLGRLKVQFQEAFAAREQLSSAAEALRQVASHPERPQRFLTRSGNTASVVSVRDIEWIEAADYYGCLHAAGKRRLLRESIRALETKLDLKKFVRLHRSAIVNLDHVREIHRDAQAEGWVLLSTRARSPESEWLAKANCSYERFRESSS